jgi:ribA/ribD-fused uncharacterized protein
MATNNLAKSSFIFFLSHRKNAYKTENWRHVFSQWYLDKNGFIDENGIKYYSREQYMMYQKAKLFNDKIIMEKVLDTIDDQIIDILNNKKTKKDYEQMISKLMGDIKSFGKDVKKFNQKTWDIKKYDIVKNGNYLHFNQNKEMKEILLKTDDKQIVEASSKDNIWGIGYDESNALDHYDHWGENLLGKAIMETRKLLQSHNL